MSIFKRGNVYWFHFVFEGRHYQQSTKQRNRNVARQIEAAVRADLAKGKVGIKKQPPAPTLEEFKPRVMEEIGKLHAADHPRTIEFYEQTFKRVLSFKPLARANLRDINEELIARFSTSQMGIVKPATINRALAVIRRALYLAEEWKLIDRAPKVRMQKGERRREFVLTGSQREEFIGGLPEPCRTVARFLLDTGLRISECCALTWDRVFIEGETGYVFVARGKSERARRYIGLTQEARAILEQQKTISRSQYVFVRTGDRVDKSLWYTAPLSRHTLSEQFTKRSRQMGLPWDAVLHSTRHTALTDFGAAGADAFTIQEIAGHASVTTSQRYVHPVPETIQRAVVRLEQYRKTEAAAQRPSLSVVPKLIAAATVSATLPAAKAAVGCK
jgi:integrase